VSFPGFGAAGERDAPPASGPVAEALAAFRGDPAAAGWTGLPFFADGSAEAVAARVDARIADGAVVLPAPADVFRALRTTPLDRVKAVILGQDPYPTPGDAHGLAFSHVGARRLPPSLKTILAEMAADLGVSPPPTGDLTPWAERGVLLINTALTVEAGKAGAHLRFGWSALTDQAVAAVSARTPAAAFLLWGGPARARAALIDLDKHLVLESGHPSPLNRLGDFRGRRPFSRANAWLRERGIEPIDWRLP
jgi:uracil-DNA glycosylase